MGYMGSYYNIPKAIFDLLKGDYRIRALGFRVVTSNIPMAVCAICWECFLLGY